MNLAFMLEEIFFRIMSIIRILNKIHVYYDLQFIFVESDSDNKYFYSSNAIIWLYKECLFVTLGIGLYRSSSKKRFVVNWLLNNLYFFGNL